MPFAYLESPDPRYLAATDILIGDMSDINYEFLLYNRPIILLTNRWIRDNWPPIGYKTDLENLKEHIRLSIDNPDLFENNRKEWLTKIIAGPFNGISKRVLKIALSHSGIADPELFFIHGNSDVRKTNLIPLFDEANRSGMRCKLAAYAPMQKKNNHIYFAAHFEDLPLKSRGYKIHLDHAPKGKGAANIQLSTNEYKKEKYFPWIDLHITAGDAGFRRTKSQLGPYSERVIIGGYPKAEYLLMYNNDKNKQLVFKELNFDLRLPLITYAPAGPQSDAKPGGSLTEDVLNELYQISQENHYNVLIKYKAKNPPLINRAINKAARVFLTHL